MINFDDVTNKNRIEHSPNWSHIPDYPYRKLITGDPGSGKTNALLKLINYQPDVYRKYLYAKKSHMREKT